MKTSIHRTTTTLCTLNILHRLRGEDKYRRLRSVGASLFRRPVQRATFFLHLSPPSPPPALVLFLSLLFSSFLFAPSSSSSSSFIVSLASLRRRKGRLLEMEGDNEFIHRASKRWNTVIIRSRGWTVAFSGTTTRVKSRLLFQPPRDRAPRGSSMADDSRGNRQLNVENVLCGR